MYTVIGSAGFIGGAISGELLRRGDTVFCPDRADPLLFSTPLGSVIYCAGVTADFRERPFDTVRAHVGFLTEILERSTFDRFVYLSSTRVYSRTPFTTEESVIPVSPSSSDDLYNISKLMGEVLVRGCGRPRCHVARLSNVIGLDLSSRNFVLDICREALSGEIRLRSDPQTAKDYIHVADAVDRLIWMAIGAPRACYNVASGRLLTHQTWIDRIVALTGCAVTIHEDGPMAPSTPIDTSAIEADFGPARRDPLDELPAILRTLEERRS
jgi:nucleoside-diphosphate-sugar epimerase